MKTKLPDFENTPMRDIIMERIQGTTERAVMYDWLVNKMTYAEIGAKHRISIATVGRILRKGRAKIFR